MIGRLFGRARSEIRCRVVTAASSCEPERLRYITASYSNWTCTYSSPYVTRTRGWSRGGAPGAARLTHAEGLSAAHSSRRLVWCGESGKGVGNIYHPSSKPSKVHVVSHTRWGEMSTGALIIVIVLFAWWPSGSCDGPLVGQGGPSARSWPYVLRLMFVGFRVLVLAPVGGLGDTGAQSGT